MGRVAVFTGNFRSVANLEKVQARIAALPDQVTAPLLRATEKGADQLVALVKEIAPVAEEFERHPGELRDSVHREPGSTPIGARVVVDAKDPDGRYYAAHVEYGHRFKDGHHAPAKPFFWPAWRHERRAIVSRISRAVTAVIKAASA
jgi:hypothetical protein